MSTFTAPIVRIRAIEPIPNADAIELAVVGDYRSVIRKGQFEPGDWAVYFPEAAVLPGPLIEELGLTGRLAGAAKNRIKAIKLRGCLSQGILYDKLPPSGREGDDVAAHFGITKYEPPIPTHMAGEVANLFGHPLSYDVENYKAYPDVIKDDELVEMTEKTHGTFCGAAVIPGLKHPEMFGQGGDGLVYSKGIGARGLAFKDVPSNEANLYVTTVKAWGVHDRIRRIFPDKTVHVFGEVYGAGIQDLAYGRKDKAFAVFDINVEGQYLERDRLALAVIALDLPRVPVLYRGLFSKVVLAEHTDGRTVMGNGAHIREGVVVTPIKERFDGSIGRVILKSISADYLLRKGETTEFA